MPDVLNDDSMATVKEDTGEGIDHRPANGENPDGPGKGPLPIRFPGYRLLKESPIGEGGRGSVYLAKDEDGREVAIKEFKADLFGQSNSSEEVEKLLDARSVVTGFVQIKKRELHTTSPYYVMPYFRKGDLYQFLRENSLSIDEKINLFEKIVKPIAAIHHFEMIHGDIKPSNVLINDSGEPEIADFGLARLGEVRPNAAGTPFFMPPEQAVSTEEGDKNWDVYALGATLYEMLSGQLPRGKSTTVPKASHQLKGEQYRKMLREADLKPLRKIDRQIDSDIARIVERCLSLKPEERPKDAGELLELLKRRTELHLQRPVVQTFALATAVLVLGVMAFAISYGNRLLQTTQAKIEVNCRNLLQNRAHLGSQLLHEKIEGRVRAIQELKKAAEKDPEFINTVLAISNLYRKEPPDKRASPAMFTDKETALLKKIGEWLKKNHAESIRDRIQNEETKRISLQISVEGKGYILAITDSEGSCTDPNKPESNHLFRTNWSWRDYYGGKGNLYDPKEANAPHPQIGMTHISQAYISKSDNRPKVDISTPYLAFRRKDGKPVPKGEDPGSTATGIFVIGIDILDDLTKWIKLKNIDDNDLRSFEELVLINDRGCCVFHPGIDAQQQGEKDLPATYRDFRKYPWAREGSKALDKYDDQHASADLKLADDPVGIQRWAYAEKIKLDLSGDGQNVRSWLLIAQMPTAVALKPVNDLYSELMILGICIISVMLLTIGLVWFQLIRILRKQRGISYA